MKDKKVFVAGCGGLGCYEVELLVRLGVGSVTVADGDRFSESNMNRQLYCTPGTLGRFKAEVAAERWPGTVTGVCSFITADNVNELISGSELVIDALDNADARKLLAVACEEAGIPLVHGAIGDTNAQCCVIFPGDRDIFDILYHGDVKRIATVSYTPALCASLQISLAAKVLRGEPVGHRILYIADLDNMDLEEIQL